MAARERVPQEGLGFRHVRSDDARRPPALGNDGGQHGVPLRRRPVDQVRAVKVEQRRTRTASAAGWPAGASTSSRLPKRLALT